MADFRAELSTRFAAYLISTGLFPEGTPLEQILALPSGEAGLVILPPRQQAFPAALFVDFGDARTRVGQLVARTETKLQESGWKRSVTEKGGTRILTFSEPEPAGNPAGRRRRPRQPIVVAIKDTTLLAATSTALVEDILSRWGGQPEKSLGQRDVYQALVAQTRLKARVPAATWFFDPVRLIDELLKQAGSSFTINMVRGSLTQLGVTQIRGAAGSFDFNLDSFDTLHTMAVQIDPPASGVASLLHMPAADLTPPFWVPADASTCIALNWNALKAFEVARGLVDGFLGDGQFQRLVDDMKNRKTGPTVDLEKEVVNQYAGPIHVVRAPSGHRDGGNRDNDQQHGLLVSIGIRDRSMVSSLLDRLAEESTVPQQSRKFNGTTIRSFQTGIAGELHSAVTHDSLMISSDARLLEAIIQSRQDTEGLATNPVFQRVRQRMPRQVSLLGFQEPVSQLRSIYVPMRRAALQNPDRSPLLSLLPRFENVAPHLRPGMSYAVPTETGFRYVSFSLAESGN